MQYISFVTILENVFTREVNEDDKKVSFIGAFPGVSMYMLVNLLKGFLEKETFIVMFLNNVSAREPASLCITPHTKIFETYKRNDLNKLIKLL